MLSGFDEFLASVTVVPDMGEDSVDDVVAGFGRDLGPRTSTYGTGVTERAVGIWSNLVAGEAPLVIQASWEHWFYGWGTTIGLYGAFSTPDVTGDGRVDVWLIDPAVDSQLLPGPLVASIADPEPAATLDTYALPADLDGDGIGEILDVYVEGDVIFHCEGPFTGLVLVDTCQMSGLEDEQTVVGMQPVEDLDGDGVGEILAWVQTAWVQTVGDDFVAYYALEVLDGDFADGRSDVLLTVTVPEGTGPSSTLVSDLDHDGYADLAWGELQPVDDGYAIEHVAVLHSPPLSGATIPSSSMSLRLERDGASVRLRGAADTDGDGSPALLLLADDIGGALVADGFVRGVADPADYGLRLAADTAPASGVMTGSFDGDTRDDVLVYVDGEDRTAWLYLGASLP